MVMMMMMGFYVTMYVIKRYDTIEEFNVDS